MRPIPQLFDPQTLVVALVAALVVAGAIIGLALAAGAVLDWLVARRRESFPIPSPSARPSSVAPRPAQR